MPSEGKGIKAVYRVMVDGGMGKVGVQGDDTEE